ncbi:MAG: EAL domain-containing protein [Cobetia marina]
MGHALSLNVTVEGVETTEQFEKVTSLSCDQLQGFYLGPPVSPSSFRELLCDDMSRQRWGGSAIERRHTRRGGFCTGSLSGRHTDILSGMWPPIGACHRPAEAPGELHPRPRGRSRGG